MAEYGIDGTGTDASGDEVEAEVDANIGLLGATAIGVGTMIAAGIFVLSGLAVSKVGTVAIVSFVIAALVAAITAAAYAEFASVYEESGGGYMYVSETFDTDLTYLMGWTMILGYPASAAFYLASFSEWFHRFLFPLFAVPSTVPYWVPGLAILGLLVLLNYRGSEESNTFQIAVTALKVLLILAFLYGGLRTFRADVVVSSFARNIGDFAAIGTTSALVFITFFGFSAIATNAEEVKDSASTIPRAIYLSMGVVTFIYALVVVVIVLAINDRAFLAALAQRVTEVPNAAAAPEFIATHGEVAMAYAAQFYLGDLGFYVIVAGALFSMLSAANATILAGSRVNLALARRGHLPTAVGDIHPDSGTPYKAVFLTGGFILVYLLVFTVLFGEAVGLLGIHIGIEGAAQYANALLIAGLTVVNVALIASRRRNPDLERGFEVPAIPWLPALGVLANVVLLVSVGVTALVMAVIAEAIGVVVWFAYVSDVEAEPAEEAAPTVLAEHEPTVRDHELLVPIANPDNVDQLLRTALDVASDEEGAVHVMSVAHVPEQTPLHRGREEIDDERTVLERALAVGEASDVPVSATVRIAHDPSTAILHAIDEHDADAALLGWRNRGDHRRRDIVLGSTVDDVVRHADCDVLVERIGATASDVDSVLVPTAGGPHAEFAAETADAIARTEDAPVTVARVVPPDADEADREAAQEALETTAAALDDVPSVERSLVDGDDVVETLAERSDDHDLTVVGASRDSALRQFLFGTIPEKLALRTEGTVIVAKRRTGLGSRAGRLIDRLGS